MIKGIQMELGDGQKYVIPPLTLGALEDLQERIENVGGLDKESVAAMIDVTLAALKRNYPDMTRETVRELVDVATMGDVFEACMDASGLKRRAIEAEAEAALAADAVGNEATAPA